MDTLAVKKRPTNCPWDLETPAFVAMVTNIFHTFESLQKEP